MRENVLGIKLGSQWTVAYGKGVAKITDTKEKIWGPRKELTCIHKVPTHLLRSDFEYRFSYEADPFDGVIYPLEYGLPKDDQEVPLIKSVLFLKEYANWLLEKAEEETGIVFCLPMMKYEEGLNQLKIVLNRMKKGLIGKKFIMEAWSAALATIGMAESLRSQVISLNFGSSTLEVALYTGKKLIAQNVYPFGGLALDRDFAHAISQSSRGVTVTRRQARLVKEQFNYEKQKSIDGIFTKNGRITETSVEPTVLAPIIEHFAKSAAQTIATQFLPTAAQASPKAVSAIQAEGIGYLCVCGGLSCMPGFPELMKETMFSEGALNENLKAVWPKNPDGVAAPAYGAVMLAELLEDEREDAGGETW